MGIFSKLISAFAKTAPSVVEVTPEPTFGGIPLSKLNELAKTIYHGIKVTVDQWGFLIFHYKSRSGKSTFKTQIKINDLGKLVSLGTHFPNQWWSSADEFVKRANELFTFKK